MSSQYPPENNVARQTTRGNIPPRTHAPQHHTTTSYEVTTEDYEELPRSHTGTKRYRPLDERERRAVAKQQPRSIIKYEGEFPYNQLPPHIRQHSQQPAVRRKRRIHWLTYVGVCLVVMLVGWIAVSRLVSWWHVWQDDIHYGRPRTTQYDVVIGHNDSADHPTHFVALNLNRRIEILEFPGGDAAKVKVYTGPLLLGDDEELDPVTLSFVDLNHDHQLDMLVTVGIDRFIFINDNGAFRTLKPNEQISQ